MSEQRLEQIEKLVIKLESDMHSMSQSMTEMAEAMKTLVKLQQEHALLRQELDYKWNSLEDKLALSKEDRARLWQAVFEQAEKLASHREADTEEHEELRLKLAKNTWFIALATAISWAVTVGVINYLFKLLPGG